MRFYGILALELDEVNGNSCSRFGCEEKKTCAIALSKSTSHDYVQIKFDYDHHHQISQNFVVVQIAIEIR